MNLRKPLAFFTVYGQSIRSSTINMAPYWIGAALTTLVSVAYTKIFALAEEFSFSWYESNPYLAFLFAPLGILISFTLVHFFSPHASGSGIPQVLAAAELSREHHPLVKRLLDIKIVFYKVLGSCAAVAGGAVVGREGPTLQISAALFYFVQRIWPKALPKPNLQSMILAGGAAGLASAFNTPIGGVIYAVEELAKVHISHVRTYIFHSVIIAGLLAQAVLGNYLYFGQIHIVSNHLEPIFPMALASIFIGMLGAAFGAASIRLFDFRSGLTLAQKVVMTLFCGLVVSLIVSTFGLHAMGAGRHLIVDILSKSTSASFGLGFARFFSSLLTSAGAGAIGGIFAPALATGAALGSWFSDFSVSYNHQIWALVGMTAFLTGVTRTPFTSLILVLEMTGTHDSIIYLMIAAITAQSAAKLVDPISFYEHVAHRILKNALPENGVAQAKPEVIS